MTSDRDRARDRADMPAGAERILDARSLASSAHGGFSDKQRVIKS